MAADRRFGHRSVKRAHALLALRQGTERNTQTVADPSFALTGGGEAVSGCSNAATSLPPWEQGENYSSYKAFDTTANGENTHLKRS